MTTRRHGVIGGPRTNKPIRPRRKQGFYPKTQEPEVIVEPVQTVEVYVATPNTEEVIHIPIKEEKIEEPDPVEEEDKMFDFESLFPKTNKCDICGFESKSERGLKSHKRWKHSIIEGV